MAKRINGSCTSDTITDTPFSTSVPMDLTTLTFLYHSSTIPNLNYQSCTTMTYNNKMKFNNLVTFYITESSQKRTPPKALTLLTDASATVQIQGMHTS
jgi:hypothetical protein